MRHALTSCMHNPLSTQFTRADVQAGSCVQLFQGLIYSHAPVALLKRPSSRRQPADSLSCLSGSALLSQGDVVSLNNEVRKVLAQLTSTSAAAATSTSLLRDADLARTRMEDASSTLKVCWHLSYLLAVLNFLCRCSALQQQSTLHLCELKKLHNSPLLTASKIGQLAQVSLLLLNSSSLPDCSAALDIHGFCRACKASRAC